MTTNVIESFSVPAASTATLTSAVNLPDGLGANPGTGFTITGLTRASDGTWWAANEGQANSEDGSYTPSLVHLSADLSSKIGEISVGSKTERSLQGLTYADGKLYVASISESLIKVYDATSGKYLSSLSPGDGGVNGLAFDTSQDAVIVGHRSGTTVEWRSATDDHLIKTMTLLQNPDHLFYQSGVGAQGALWYTYGDSGAGATGHVVEVDIATGATLRDYSLKNADAVEGIYVSGDTMWLANDAYYHSGNPALNRTLQFSLSDLTVPTINKAPTSVYVNGLVKPISESTSVAGGIKIADMLVTDDGLGTNLMTLSGTDAANFQIRTVNGNNSLYYVGPALNYSHQSSYSVIVTDSDPTLPGSASVHRTVNVSITAASGSPINHAPTAVSLMNGLSSIAENRSVTGGVKVGDIVVADDGIGTNALTLSGADAASFAIRDGADGSHALYYVGGSPDFEAKSGYAVSIDVQDPTVSGAIAQHALYNLSVIDINEAPTGIALSNAASSLLDHSDIGAG